MARKDDAPPPAAPFHNPFGKLQGLRESLPVGAAEPKVVPLEPKGPARAVVSREKSGRGGKEVTRVAKLELRGAILEAWCKELKQALGCGGTVEGDDLIFQGDQRPRLPELLTKRGVRKVILG